MSPQPTSASRAVLARRVAAVLLSVSAAALVTGCLSPDGFENNNRYGSITIESTGAESGRVLATAVASFFRGNELELPTSVISSDNCGTFNFVTEAFTPGNLAAGAEVQLRVGSTSYVMAESPQVPRLYVLSGQQSFSYAAGDSVRVTVPGVTGGFPAAQIALRLAEPVALGPVTAGEINQDLPVSWTSTGDANSSVIISLRYTTSQTTTVPNVQVLCIVRDNGGYAIPAAQLGNYYASNPASRELNVLRWRTNTVDVDERTALYIVSTADTTVALQQ